LAVAPLQHDCFSLAIQSIVDNSDVQGRHVIAQTFQVAPLIGEVISMWTRRLGMAVLIAALATALALPTSAADAKASWVGKLVLTKEYGLKIDTTDTKTGAGAELVRLTDAVYKVEADDGQWIKVRHHGEAGWLKKRYAVLPDDAVDYFTERIRDNNTDAQAYCFRALAWRMKGNLDAAMMDLNEAIRFEPTEAVLFNNRGTIWHEKKDYDKALADYDKAVRLNPKFFWALVNRGIIWTIKEDYDKALADYNEAIRLEPKEATAFHCRGIVWQLKEDYDKALADYSEAVRLDPHNGKTFVARGLVWELKQKYDKALKDHDEAVHLDPQNSLALNLRAWLWATCSDPKYRNGNKALESAKRACELVSGKKPDYLETLAAAYAETGNFDEAVKQQKKAIELAAADKNYDLKKARERLKLYEAGKPYRDDEDGMSKRTVVRLKLYEAGKPYRDR
jgi:tetratricopeptide (TPR) repeat protein